MQTEDVLRRSLKREKLEKGLCKRLRIQDALPSIVSGNAKLIFRQILLKNRLFLINHSSEADSKPAFIHLPKQKARVKMIMSTSTSTKVEMLNSYNVRAVVVRRIHSGELWYTQI